MRAILRLFPLSLLFFLLLIGCAVGPTGGDPSGSDGDLAGGPGSENPATRPTPGFTEVEMRPATSTTLPAPASFLKSLQLNVSPLIAVDEVRLFLKDLDFDDALSPGVESAGPFVVRLVQASGIVDEALPPFGTVGVPEGLYERMDLKLETLDASEIPPGAEDDPLVTGPLVGHSVVVEGTLQITPILNISLIRFRFLSREAPALRVETPEALDFGPGLNRLFIAFKIKTWLDLSLPGLIDTVLQTLDLPTLLSILNGVLVISADSPIPEIRAIALQIEANIHASLRFAPSEDAFFDEADVQENSFSFVIP